MGSQRIYTILVTRNIASAIVFVAALAASWWFIRQVPTGWAVDWSPATCVGPYARYGCAYKTYIDPVLAAAISVVLAALVTSMFLGLDWIRRHVRVAFR